MNINKKIYLCAINNIESGTCNEDCKFCTQSIKHKANINRYKRKSIKDIVFEAKIAKKNMATGYCLVTAGLELNDKKVEFICNIAFNIKKDINDLNLIACNGLANKEQLKELKKSGINSYNHNLETSKDYYKKICSTHSWDSRFQTCEYVNSVGLNLVCGGIFGMGENDKDRLSLMKSIALLKPKTVPLNFFHPHKALPLNNNILDKTIAFEIIKKAKNIINPKKLMVAGGREITFEKHQYEIFKYGANAIVIGDYLTTSGNSAFNDIENIKNLGLKIAKNG